MAAPKIVESPVAEKQTDPEEAARNRATLCAQKVAEVLREHGCQIVPFVQPAEMLEGRRGVIVRASYGIIPEAR